MSASQPDIGVSARLPHPSENTRKQTTRLLPRHPDAAAATQHRQRE